MFWSGSRRPDQPIWKAVNLPCWASWRAVVNSVGWMDTLNPAGLSMDWMTDASLVSRSLPASIISGTVIGVRTPLAATSCLALLMSWLEQGRFWYQGLAGEIGVHPGTYRPPKTTLLITWRLRASLKASLSSGCCARTLIAVVKGGWPAPWLLETLIVIPSYPRVVTGSSLTAESFLRLA